jgi:hypothetical protein
MMKFEIIYRESILLWPDSIDLSDGKLIEETKGFYSENLSSAWDKAEESASNEWQSLLVWIFFQELHRKAVECFKANRFYLNVDSIDMKILKQAYLNTLKEEGYENMLNQIDE